MFKVLTDGCEPTKGSKHSACIDLYASEDVTIGAGETKLIGLGVCIDEDSFLYIIENYAEFTQKFGEKFYRHAPQEERLRFFKESHYLQLMLRSSLGKKGLILPNGVGVIDLDYKDEIKMIIHNPTQRSYDFGEHGRVEIENGDKIGQITLLEHKAYLFGVETEDERTGGFGSTDIKDKK